MSRFRGEVLGGDGFRPAFASRTDPHPADPDAYHLIVRNGPAIAGCVSVGPVEALSVSAVRSWSPELSARLLAERGLDDSAVVEIARLVVAPEWRGRRLGLDLVLGTVALARLLGRRLMWCTAGTRQNQHRLALAIGLRLRAEYGRRDAPELADTLCVLAGDPRDVPAPVRSRLAELHTLIDHQLAPA
ncbi:GNAT family N-acetyltransferase [Symbioplanes lichenis]|uniref:GNAT family N-acetyltransferase n=1 Tax=Symbioplanes lichenis TaxID=1629072 RepID=UPI002738A7E3|nr:GNAT family N-acetyltransferase [Actinoplanes lichenis]